MLYDEELDQEQMVELEKAVAAREAMLASLSLALLETRDKAVSARLTSGIEVDWDEDEDAYEGIDDANRGERAARKPHSSGGAIISERERPKFGSTVLINITRPYCDAASAKVTDMMLPTDDRPWGLKARNRPELVQMEASPIVLPDGTTGKDMAERIRRLAAEHAEIAEHVIEDWLTECGWHDELRIVIEDAARMGTGVLKGPYPRRVKRVAMTEAGVRIEHETKPYSKAVHPRNLFPDPNCGTSIHNGSYVWERDTLTSKRLRQLKGGQYLDDQIDKCLKEGPQKRHVEDSRIDGGDVIVSDWDQFEVWYCHGELDRDELLLAGVEELPEGEDALPAICTMVNDRLIKAVLSPLDSGRFPYDLFVWQRRQGMPWGQGIARQIRDAQRMVVGGIRELMDNAGLSGGPQIILRRGAVEPADGVWEIVPRKLWFLKKDEIARVEDVLMAINIPSMQAQLIEIVNLGLRMAEDSAGLPMLLQGQQGQAPDTVGGMQILSDNAHTVLRRLARNLDNVVTEPHLVRYYEYLLLHGPEEAKGDFVVDASGSSALVERQIQNQAIIQMGEMVMNPMTRADFRINPVKWFAEMAKSQRIDPKRFQYDEGDPEAEKQIPPEVQMQMQQLQQALEQAHQQIQQLTMRAQGHEIRAQATIQGKQIDAQTRLQTEQMRGQRDEQLEHVRGQYQMELEGLRAELSAVDKQINAGKLELDRGKLALQAEALRHQIARMEREMAEKVREFDVSTAMNVASNPLDQGPIGPDTGALKGVMQRDQYGMIPDARG